MKIHNRDIIKRLRFPSTIYHLPSTNSRGFTIIELMLATLVFSVILLLITFGVIDFNRAYYKGIIQSETQNVARTVLENISQAIQFSGDPITPYPTGITATGAAPSNGMCIGNQRYSFILGDQLVNGAPGMDQTNHALVRDTWSNCGRSSPAQDLQGTLSSDSTELLGQNMRLSALLITPLPQNASVYTIKIRVAYGDNDLLCSPSIPGNCASPNSIAGAKKPNATCKISAGSQFCAVSELTTTVQKRIN